MARTGVGRFVPREHGAWAMLLVPYLLGSLAAEPAGDLVPLLLLLMAWVSAYAASHFGVLWYRTRRRPRRGRQFRAPTLLYLSACAVSGSALAWLEPWTLIAVWLFVPFAALAVVLALRGAERSWVAGASSATGASLMAPVSYRVADGHDGELAATLFLICWLAFVGSVLHVKSTIRERDDPRFRTASVVFHGVALVVAVAVDPLLVVPFGFLLARAVLVPRHGWRPARIGAVEVVGSVLVLVVPLLAL